MNLNKIESMLIMSKSRFSGLPDLAFSSQDDFVAQAGVIANLVPSIPLISDADTGFGGPAQIARTVMRYVSRRLSSLRLLLMSKWIGTSWNCCITY